MNATRRATRNTVGNELSAEQVQQTYGEVLHTRTKIKRTNVLGLINQFFERDEVEVEAKRVSLKCPLSQVRIKDAVRGSLCRHIQCFDLQSYLDYHTTLAFWECPFTFCRQKVHCDQLRLDEYMTDVIRNVADIVTEVDVFADGDYKPVEVPAAVVVKTIADEEPYVNDMATEPWVKMEEEEIFEEQEPVLAVTQESGQDVHGSSGSDHVHQGDPRSPHPQESDRDAQGGSDSYDYDHPDPTPARRFQCQECAKSFIQRIHLDAHMRIHTGESPSNATYAISDFGRKAASQNITELIRARSRTSAVTVNAASLRLLNGRLMNGATPARSPIAVHTARKSSRSLAISPHT